MHSKNEILRKCGAVLLLLLIMGLAACGKSAAVTEVEDAITKIGKVTLDSGTAITTAQKKYDALDEKERADVSNYQTLVASAERFSRLEEKHYQQCYDDAVGKMLDTLVIAEKMCNQTLDVWHNAIWKTEDEETNAFTKDDNGRFFDDFNDALNKLSASDGYREQRDALQQNDAELQALVSVVKDPPEKFKGSMLDAFVDYYAEYQGFIQFIQNYNESYNSFSEKFNQFEETSINAYREAAFFTSRGK